MLVSLRARRAVLVLPLWSGLGALACATLAVRVALRAEWKLSVSISVFALALGWIAMTELVAIWVEQGVLRVWRPGKRQRLSARDLALGVRLRPSSRTAVYVAFVTDGTQSCELTTHVALRGARRSAERIGETLHEAGHGPGASATRAVAAQEQVWQANAEQAQRAVDEFYRSPAWKRSKRIMIALVSVYVVGLGLYQWLSGAR